MTSTDQTPAVDRAAGRHELFNRVPFPPACSCGVEMPDGNVRENFAAHLDDVARTARAVVSRALHDPDDPDWLPNVIAVALREFHAGPCDQPIQAHVADAVRLAILGHAHDALDARVSADLDARIRADFGATGG